MSIDEKVRQVVTLQLGIDARFLSPSVSFVDDLGADRQDLLMLVLALENTFQVALDDAEPVHNIGQAVAFFASRSVPP